MACDQFLDVVLDNLDEAVLTVSAGGGELVDGGGGFGQGIGVGVGQAAKVLDEGLDGGGQFAALAGTGHLGGSFEAGQGAFAGLDVGEEFGAGGGGLGGVDGGLELGLDGDLMIEGLLTFLKLLDFSLQVLLSATPRTQKFNRARNLWP